MNMKKWLLKSRDWYSLESTKSYKKYIRDIKNWKNEPYSILVNLGDEDDEYVFIKICIPELYQERHLTEYQRKLLKFIENEATNSKTLLGISIKKDKDYKIKLKDLLEIEKELNGREIELWYYHVFKQYKA